MTEAAVWPAEKKICITGILCYNDMVLDFVLPTGGDRVLFMIFVNWNPWHGCHKISAGCLNCYVYRQDAAYDRDASAVAKTGAFNLPVRKKRSGEYKISAGSVVNTCFTSDFFLEDADEWREEAWAMMRKRSDLRFFLITKRIHRFKVALPADWGGGYENVAIGCTVENQQTADYRLPIFRELPIKHKKIIAAPLLERLDLRFCLGSWCNELSVGGESGSDARVCDFDWVMDLREQCAVNAVPFFFYQTGARLRKNGKIYRILRKYQHQQAKKAGIDHKGVL